MRAKTYEYEGEMLTIRQIATIIGARPERLRDFVRYGNTLEDAIRKCHRPANHRYLTVNGKTRSITEWARVTGVDRTTITQRVDKGLPPEACIFNGNITAYRPNAEPDITLPLTEQEREKAKKNIDRKLAEMDGKRMMFRVRWCDRTSHSHAWRDSEVERSELQKFLDTHYLAKVVVNW